ncbi:DNA-binding response regulator, OmpR family, contains REC and winged-helix (wHTH) domain [Parapedobacter composti]|uniref:DNA-binding response regulator, OmpR family, contains REC and winged-helix (WHTH) domain n=1 Tax=Parapedobacter composti TaxID=623281 RepID=A0A1I1JHP6_9SPHI|nr:response regulator transcription factor [Parapedobacter composti]SFC47875.1 DNA-binding response regulator, OmpR family, contains REC and winged-helix (wHTH) domain [Parapedobacter composti]
MKILIIEDEEGLRDNISQFLNKEQYTVETAGDFHAAMEKIAGYDYDCILLDVGLPNGNGLDILKSLKFRQKRDNVIIISARDSLDDKLEGLGLGADDYLTKPFHLAELNARIKAVLRRKALGGRNVVKLNNMELDFDERTVSVSGTDIHLNRKEFDILAFFVVNKNRLIYKSALAEHVWGDHMDNADNFDFIYSQIKNLRKKLKEHGTNLEIQAIYGVGYKLTV